MKKIGRLRPGDMDTDMQSSPAGFLPASLGGSPASRRSFLQVLFPYWVVSSSPLPIRRHTRRADLCRTIGIPAHARPCDDVCKWHEVCMADQERQARKRQGNGMWRGRSCSKDRKVRRSVLGRYTRICIHTLVL